MDEIKDFIAARDKAMAGTLDDFIAYAQGQGQFQSHEVVEIAYHKCRTAVKSLSPEIRRASHEWLVSRGYESWFA